MKEKLRLVTDFGELRSGMITVVKGCICGSRACRAMVTTPGEDEAGPYWNLQPVCFVDEDGDGVVVGKNQLHLRTTYRVLDGLDKKRTATSTSKRETLRAR